MSDVSFTLSLRNENIKCIFQLLLIIFAVVLLCSGGNNKKNKVRPAEKKGYKPQKAERMPYKKHGTLNY